jgi:flagellar hook-associated protein 1 FlgK
MSDLLGIGASGIRAYQAALAVTGDNIANTDTAGYVRRNVRLAPGPVGASTPYRRDRVNGSGVVAGDIGRATDALKANAACNASADHARFAARGDWQTRLQTVVTGSEIDARIGGFFDAATDLAAAPTSIAARTIFLDRAGQAASGFSALGNALARLADDIDVAAGSMTDEVNAITSALARVNDELRRIQAGGAGANVWATAGTDALDDPGTPLFSTPTLIVRAGKANAGMAGIDVTIADGAPSRRRWLSVAQGCGRLDTVPRRWQRQRHRHRHP